MNGDYDSPGERKAREDGRGAHLHLSVYKATVRDKIWSKRDSNYVKDEKLRNPFNRNHRFDTDGDL